MLAAMALCFTCLHGVAQARVMPDEKTLQIFDIGATASGSYLAGRQAMRQRDYEAASRFMQRTLELDPRAPGLARNALALFISTGQWQSAAALARRIVRTHPRHRLARMVLGLQAALRNDMKTARAHFIKAAASPLGVLSGGMLAAWTWLAKPDLREGLKSLDILDSYPAFSAFKVYHKALMADLAGHAVRAGKLYARAWKENPGSMRLTWAYGNFLRRQGRARKAIAIYERFLRSVPDNAIIRAQLAETRKRPRHKPLPMVGSVRDGMAEVLFSLTSALLDERSYDSALLHARMTLALRPGLHVARMLLGETNESLRRREQALAAYMQVPPGHPLYATARLRAARVLHGLGRVDEAIALLRKLSREAAGDSRPFSLLGDVLRSEKRWKDASAAYTAALKIMRRQGRGNWRLFYNRGITYERAGAWKKAERDFRQALKLQPGQPSVLNYLGYSLIDRGERLKEALGMVKRAVQARPNDGYIVDSLGWAYYRLGKYHDAVRELERAVSLLPTDPVINDHLGDAYWRVGRRLEARFQWRHALDGRPAPEPELKRKLLDKLAHGPRAPHGKGKGGGNGNTSAPLAAGNAHKPKG